jgi:hypothetical protein
MNDQLLHPQELSNLVHIRLPRQEHVFKAINSSSTMSRFCGYVQTLVNLLPALPVMRKPAGTSPTRFVLNVCGLASWLSSLLPEYNIAFRLISG